MAQKARFEAAKELTDERWYWFSYCGFKALLRSHFQTPHMAEFRETLGRLGVSETRLQKYEVAEVGPLGG